MNPDEIYYYHPMRKIILLTAILLGGCFIATHLEDMGEFVQDIYKGDWHYIVLCVVLACAWLVNVATSYKVIYRALGIKTNLRDLIPAAAASFFTNIVAPTGGASGVAVFILQARQRKYSSARAALAFAVFLEFEYMGVLSILMLGLVALFRRNSLTVAEVSAAIFLTVVTCALAFLIYLGMHSRRKLANVLIFCARLINRILYPWIHREWLSEHQAHDFAFEAACGLKELSLDPKRLLAPAFLGLSSKVIQLAILFLVFQAFQVPTSLGTIFAAYGLSILFVIVSPTPSGIGVVEGVLVFALISMNIDAAAAAIVTVVYRGFTFWFPLTVGLFAFRWLGRTRSPAQA